MKEVQVEEAAVAVAPVEEVGVIRNASVSRTIRARSTANWQSTRASTLVRKTPSISRLR